MKAQKLRQPHEELDQHFAGELLYGDDFSPAQIRDWYEDEKNGYAELGAKDQDRYQYGYHALNFMHGYRHLPARFFEHALGFGSAYGDELTPLVPRLKRVTIVDPSDYFREHALKGVPCEYVPPSPDGKLPFSDESFDLITCLGVLHHIPNVSFVFSELARCLSYQGWMVVREPIISMGDWRMPRLGLTKRERGIPYAHFRKLISKSRLRIHKASFCVFPGLARVAGRLGFSAYNNTAFTKLDALLSAIFAGNTTYHRTALRDKFGPASIFLVLRRDQMTELS